MKHKQISSAFRMGSKKRLINLCFSGSFSSVFKLHQYIPMVGKHKSNHMLESSSGWSRRLARGAAKMG